MPPPPRTFDFTLNLSRYVLDPQTGEPVVDNIGRIDDEGAYIRALPEQLGLRLVRKLAPLEVLVIDHIEKDLPPTSAARKKTDSGTATPWERANAYIGIEDALTQADDDLAHTEVGSSGGTRRSAGDDRGRRRTDAASPAIRPAADDPGEDRLACGP
jgi:hypothetical protein